MAGQPKKQAKRRARMEYFEGSLGKDMSLEERAGITAIPVIFRPPRLDDCEFSPNGAPFRWGFGTETARPALFQDGEELAECTDRYFEWCANQRPPRPPTIAGLAIALGFKSKPQMFNYIKKGEDFQEVIELAITRIEDYKNVMLVTTERSPNGLIMDLINNHQWKQRSESTTTVTHEAGSDLSRLLGQLQGNVLRPKTITDQFIDGAVDAEFTPVEEDSPADQTPKLPVKPPRLKKYMLSDNIDDLI